MATVEVVGKTLEEARQIAAEQLGCDEAEMTVEVVDEPSRFLGILGGGEFRIRATFGEPEEPVQQAEAADQAEDAEPDAPEAAEAEAEGEQSIPDLVANTARASLEEIVSLMGLDVQVSVKEIAAEEVALEVTGADAGRIIGRHGATLDALQLLVAVIANRGLVRGARVIVDAESYRAKREQMLVDMALTHAAQAKEASKEIVIRDLKPYERRIIHMALVDDPDVETYSEGEDDDRQLVISPVA